MRISFKHRYVMFDIPKSASTSITFALRGVSECIIDGNGGAKHMLLADYEEFLEPFFLKRAGKFVLEFERLAVVREPLDMLGSYYKYLRRPAALNPEHPDFRRHTADVSFAEYAQMVCDRTPNRFSNVTRPSGFVADKDHRIGIDTLFAFERLDDLAAHMSEKCGQEINIPQRNVSPQVDLGDIGNEARRLIEDTFAADFALYRAVKALPAGQTLRARGRRISEL